MSELIQVNAGQGFFRKKLLTTVCSLALLTAATAAHEAAARESDHPTVWIELGGQLERMGDSEEIFAPSFLSKFEDAGLDSGLSQQRPPRYSNGGEGKISISPNGSNWVFSAAVRYGRANGERAFNQQLPKFAPIKGQNVDRSVYYITQKIPVHLNTLAQHVDRHLVLDFQVGKDVGLGLFHGNSDSTFSLGVRFAQFTAARKAAMNGAPNFTVIGTSKKYGLYRSRHHYSGSVTADTSFHGVGPSLSWDANAPLVERGDDGQISVDWGINAAVLFGRQKAKGESFTLGTHYTNATKVRPPQKVTHNNFIISQDSSNFDRTRAVVVPNIGAFAGISFRYSDVKVSAGYRADLFFGSGDGGIASRKSENRSFYGPFASFSIGLGE
jgi:hypothetical protein